MGDRLRIVVADGDKESRECLRRWLVELGHEVVAVNGGASLIDTCRASTPDLVISDVGKPDLACMQAVEAIRWQSAVPVILLSGSRDVNEPERAAAGATRCLSKPVRPLELIAAVEAVHASRNYTTAAAVADARLPDFAEGAISYGILTTDPGGRLVQWNSGAQRLLGLEPGDVGRSWAVTFTPDDARDCIPERDLKAAEAGAAERQRWCRRRDGSRVWALVAVEPIRRPDGVLSGFGVVLRDWTEFKQREELIVARGVALFDADERRAALLDVVAHELRNCLGPMAADARRLLGGAAPADVARRLIENIGRLNGVVDDLLDAEGLYRGKVRLLRRRVDAREVAGGAVEAARLAVADAHVSLSLSLPLDPLWLDADPDRLNQVLVILMEYAARRTPDGGRVEYSAVREKGEVVLRVRDGGPKIPPDQLATVFDLDSRYADPTLRMGVGLAVVRELVQLHGGTVQAASAGDGLGSEFVVRLPAAAEGG
jgi:PAS domain S-box-containing protein